MDAYHQKLTNALATLQNSCEIGVVCVQSSSYASYRVHIGFLLVDIHDRNRAGFFPSESILVLPNLLNLLTAFGREVFIFYPLELLNNEGKYERPIEEQWSPFSDTQENFMFPKEVPLDVLLNNFGLNKDFEPYLAAIYDNIQNSHENQLRTDQAFEKKQRNKIAEDAIYLAAFNAYALKTNQLITILTDINRSVFQQQEFAKLFEDVSNPKPDSNFSAQNNQNPFEGIQLPDYQSLHRSALNILTPSQYQQISQNMANAIELQANKRKQNLLGPE